MKSLGVERILREFKDQNNFMEVQTSGSTGVPKIIKIEKSHMRASAQMTLDFLGLQKGNKALLCMSPAHIGGIMMMMRAELGDLNLTIVEPSARPLENLEGNFDFVAMVPYQVAASIDDLHRIKKLIIGGGPISPDLEDQLRNLPNEIYHTYGMTETISHIAMRRVNGSDNETFKTLPGIEIYLDERGCLVINAPALGVKDLATNDLVELKSADSFVWLGRHDNVVNSAGVKLHPESIEKKIGDIGYPYFLAGVQDTKFGESLVMVVESDEPMEFETIKNHFQALGKYEIPKQIFTVPKFVMTESGKLNRKETLNRIAQ
ncbi:AMP-binding protein [Owenweeksia hongkongensis]|uniref:AMP-binding protein n=1 Tax=Owenweeksia hongkongensis TaxID=253245 RepID=UPI003A8DDCCA